MSPFQAHNFQNNAFDILLFQGDKNIEFDCYTKAVKEQKWDMNCFKVEGATEIYTKRVQFKNALSQDDWNSFFPEDWGEDEARNQVTLMDL